MITIKDVAKYANVGSTTVSRVINNSNRVSPETKAKVEDAMKALNYSPNEYARILKSNKSKTIGVSVPSIWHPFFSEFVFHIENTLYQHEYKLLLCSNNIDMHREIEFLEMVKQNKVDGIIAISYSNLDNYLSANIPFVSIDRYFKEKVVYVTSNNYHGGELAAEELIKKGCKKLAYLAAVAPRKNDTLKRKDGFVDFAQKHNVSVNTFERPEPILDYPQFFNEFFSSYPQTDGILAMNDQTALILLDYLAEHNRKVPEEIQVVGYDGFHYFAGYQTTLTTVKQPIQQMAETSVQTLLDIIAGKEVKNPIVLPVSFQHGNTTKPSTPVTN